MKSVDSKTLQAQYETLNKAIVQGSAKGGETIARKTMYEPYDGVFTGRGSGV